MATRVRVGLLFGGRSAEHDVSKLSAANVLSALDPSRYEVVPIGISREAAGASSRGLSRAPRCRRSQRAGRRSP